MDHDIRVRLGLSLFFAAAAAFLIHAQATPTLPRQRAAGVEDFDARALAARRSPVRPDTAAALTRFRGRTARPLHARVHPLTGAIRRLSGDEPLSAPRVAAPSAVASDFLRDNADLVGLTDADLSELTLVREYRSANDVATHLTYQQTIDGVPVFEGLVGVHVALDGSVVLVTSEAVPPPRGRTRPRLDASEAVQAAVADVQAVPAAPVPTGATLVYFPAPAGLRPAWRVYVEADPGRRAHVVVIDALTGDTLYRRNTYHDTDGVGRIFQSATTAARDLRLPEAYPIGSAPPGPDDPAGGCPPASSFELRSLNEPFRDPETTLFNTGRLEGNNASVYRGQQGVWGALGAFGAGMWQFDFPFNTPDSVETAIFHTLNFAHDFFYDLGFDEAAGNFQALNFGRGGLGGDPLIAISRAAGRNNANIEVSADGQPARMNLFLWDGAGCWSADVDGDGVLDLDGGYDTDVVIHEYHHGVSIRLNPAWSGNEAAAIGEGGSDFFAYSIHDDTDLAEYSAPPSGIRHVNGKTYADWYCLFNYFCEPHDNGEIWANALWDLRESFRTALVGGSEADGIGALHQLYVDGLKLSPPAPTMLDMRDAMLTADALRHPSGDLGSSANYCRLWQGFAGRGMGVGALDTRDSLNNSVLASFAVPAGCPGPVVVSIAATTPTAREAGPVQGAFTVSRTGDHDDELAVSYSVQGTATAWADYLPLTGTVTIPAGALDASIALVPVDDTLYELDETVVVSIDPTGAYIVGSPSSATVVIVSDDISPDLVVSALSAPAAGSAGGSLAVTATVENRGQGTADPSVTRMYLSFDLLVDAGDVSIGSRAVGPLAPGAAESGTTEAVLPAELLPGLYYLLVVADADQAVNESVETNNLAWTTARIGPDLTISSLSAPSAIGEGQAFTATDTTTNTGAAPAAASTTRFFLSTNAVVDPADTPLAGSRSVPALAAGGASSGSTVLTVPAGITPGQYYLLAQADADGTVAESQEGNNSRFAPVRVGPDLVLSAFTAQAVADLITLTDTVANDGGGAAASSVVRFYLSNDATLDAGDVALDGSRAVPPLAAGTTSSGTTSAHLPAGTPPGPHFVLAVADADHTVAETVETNNLRYTTVAVGGGGDLVVYSLSAPSVAGAGSAVTVTDATRNVDSSAAGASTTRYFLSTDYWLGVDDVRLDGGRAVPPLSGGQTNGGSTIVTLPAGVAVGRYYLIAKADGDDVVGETNENNNTMSRSIAVGPDLIVSSFISPTRAGAGEPITVTETTRNQGGGTAGASLTRFYLSRDYRLDAADTPLGIERSVPSLVPGGSSTASTTLMMPTGLAVGGYFVIAASDDAGAVTETSETNNTRYVYLQVGPDLTVTSLAAPASAPAGSLIVVTDTTTNAGGGAAPPSVTRYYLSANPYLDAADVPLESARLLTAIAAGASDTGSTAVTIPAGMAPGGYYLIAVADAAGSVPETVETNNTRFRSLQVLPAS